MGLTIRLLMVAYRRIPLSYLATTAFADKKVTAEHIKATGLE
jgi:hypothetical protein